MNDNQWINDERLASISSDKKDFINQIFFELNSLKQEEKLPFIMALMSSQKLNRLSMEDKEVTLMIQVLKDYTDPAQLEKIQTMMQFFKHS